MKLTVRISFDAERMDEMINIKKASEETGVSADTIRYYERIGLIPPIKRNENGVREFDEEDLKWIAFSRQMRNAGLSIESLIEYLALFRSGEETVPARMDLLVEQQHELQELPQDAVEHRLPQEERLKNLLDKVGNPYCYLDSGIIVKLNFAPRGGSTLSERVGRCFQSAS